MIFADFNRNLSLYEISCSWPIQAIRHLAKSTVIKRFNEFPPVDLIDLNIIDCQILKELPKRDLDVFRLVGFPQAEHVICPPVWDRIPSFIAFGGILARRLCLCKPSRFFVKDFRHFLRETRIYLSRNDRFNSEDSWQQDRLFRFKLDRNFLVTQCGNICQDKFMSFFIDFRLEG